MGQFHFDPASYLELIRADVPRFEEFQDEVPAATIGPVAGEIRQAGSSAEVARARRVRRSATWSWNDVAVLVSNASTPVPGTGAAPRRPRP